MVLDWLKPTGVLLATSLSTRVSPSEWAFHKVLLSQKNFAPSEADVNFAVAFKR